MIWISPVPAEGPSLAGFSLWPPSWWYGPSTPANSIASALLTPVAALYGGIAARRMASPPSYISAKPVICVGNFTAGGTGKTPFARWLAREAREIGATPVFLSRGYGGRMSGPVLVDRHRHTAADVGDEPLLLSADAQAVICRDRSAGARFIETNCPEADLIIMDDGLQNPSLAKSASLAVIDGKRGLGNARVIPAGPLRAPLPRQLRSIQAAVINLGDVPALQTGAPSRGSRDAEQARLLRDLALSPLPSAVKLWRMAIRPTGAPPSELLERPLFAFAGIGSPERFYATLRSIGGTIQGTRSFRDHQPLSDADAEELQRSAQRDKLQLVTTEKDFVRLDPASPVHRELARQTAVLQIEAHFSDADAAAIRTWLSNIVQNAGKTDGIKDLPHDPA